MQQYFEFCCILPRAAKCNNFATCFMLHTERRCWRVIIAWVSTVLCVYSSALDVEEDIRVMGKIRIACQPENLKLYGEITWKT